MTNGHLLRDRRGASAAEFALVLPAFLIIFFGVIDGGRWMWAMNRAEKATQAGARVAVVTQLIPSGLATSYVNVNGLTQGDVIPASALGKVVCTKTGQANVNCTCQPPTGALPCPSPLGPFNSSGWDAIVRRMSATYSPIASSNVVVEYSGSGLGYAGDPDGQDISPLVTVRLRNLGFRPITLLAIHSMLLPTTGTTLTAEDELGNYSN